MVTTALTKRNARRNSCSCWPKSKPLGRKQKSLHGTIRAVFRITLWGSSAIREGLNQSELHHASNAGCRFTFLPAVVSGPAPPEFCGDLSVQPFSRLDLSRLDHRADLGLPGGAARSGN